MGKSADNPETGAAAIARAEAALEELSANFDAWMADEVARLSAAWPGPDAGRDAYDAVFAVAHDLKGQGDTLGYPSVTPVCTSLCQLCALAPHLPRLPGPVVTAHVQAIAGLVRAGIRDAGDETAASAASALAAIVDHLARSIAERQAAAA